MAAIIRELAGQQKLTKDTAVDLLFLCATDSHILSCAELMQVVSNPRTHPFMHILMVKVSLERSLYIYSTSIINFHRSVMRQRAAEHWRFSIQISMPPTALMVPMHFTTQLSEVLLPFPERYWQEVFTDCYRTNNSLQLMENMLSFILLPWLYKVLTLWWLKSFCKP